MRRFTMGLAAILLIASGGWWLLFEGSAPGAAPGIYDAELYRTLIASDTADLPRAVHIEFIGTDTAPAIAAEAGNVSGEYQIAYTSFAISWADGRRIVIGGAVDGDFVNEMAQSPKTAQFDDNAYARMAAAMLNAEQVYITHAHPDHIIGILRHRDPANLAPRLKLRAHQLQTLDIFAQQGTMTAGLAPELAAIEPFEVSRPTRIAPGVVLVPNPGHSPSSQSFFVKTTAGEEFFLIGDIVWTMSNLDTLKTRPRLLQYMLFDPPEDRQQVLAQVRALHDLREAEQELSIVPSHDRFYLEALVRNGKLVNRFDTPPKAP